MIRLLYISTARQQPTPEMLADILRASRRNNAAAGVSGLLIVGGRRFLQALEDLAVLTTFARINKDPRHFAVVQLGRETITERQFAQWSMGAQAGGRPGETASISQAVAALIAPITNPSLKGYFTGFSERQAAA